MRRRIIFSGCLCAIFLGLSTTSFAQSRIWDGYNPYHQPMNTTQYYGSGDVDLDGQIGNSDVDLAFQMAMGMMDPNPMADVDGNGVVENADFMLIWNYTNDPNTPLPGHWNHLTSAQARQDWLDKMLALDETEDHQWVYEWYLCGHFLRQIYSHFTGYVGDLYGSQFSGGQTLFNIPTYDVGIPAHGINGILIGDDPQNIDDWFFLDTYSDNAWDIMKYNTGAALTINAMDHPGYGFTNMLTFRKTATGYVFEDINPDFTQLRARPAAPAPTTPINSIDIWTPVIIGADGGKILYDSLRQDMSRTTDIHIADLPFDFNQTPDGEALIHEENYARLLDIIEDGTGNAHILYMAKPDANPAGYVDRTPGVFYASLNLNTNTVSNTVRLFTDDARVRTGRLLQEADGTIHAFWYENQDPRFTSYPDTGVYWSSNDGSGWSAETNLTPSMDADENDDEFADTDKRDFYRYIFDAAISNGQIWLVWTERVSGVTDSTVSTRTYNGSNWSAAQVIDSGNTRGLDIADFDGDLHLVTWNGARPSSVNEGRGNLNHKFHNGSTWSGTTTIDNSGEAACPKMVDAGDAGLVLVWESEGADGMTIAPMTSTYKNGAWQAVEELSIRPDADCWYPMAAVVDDTVQAVFSSRSDDFVTAETVTIDTSVVSLSDLSVDYYSPNTALQQDTISVNLRIQNRSADAVTLSSLAAEYYYGFEGSSSESAVVDWCGVFPGGQNVMGDANLYTINQGGQDRSMELTFDAGQGDIPAGGFVQCSIRIHKNDWSNYTQTDDYSFGTHGDYTEWDKITLSQNGLIAWGIEP